LIIISEISENLAAEDVAFYRFLL